MSRLDWLIGCAAASAVLAGCIVGCSSGGSGSEMATGQEEATEPTPQVVAAIQVDPATAVRLRRLADSSVTSAVRALGPAEGLPLDELGARLYRTRGCIECHGPGDDPIGPSLVGAFGTLREVEGRQPILMDLDYINVALMRPDSLIAKGYPAGEMPGFEGTLYPREVLALAVYLQSLSEPPRLPEGSDAIMEIDPERGVERVDSPLMPEVDEADPADAVPEATASEASEPRADGRPGWWFDGVQREDGRVSVCVETLGDTFSDARSAAIERGHSRLSEILGLAPNVDLREPQVKFIWVTPLPNRGTQQRYAAYAQMSADAGD